MKLIFSIIIFIFILIFKLHANVSILEQYFIYSYELNELYRIDFQHNEKLYVNFVKNNKEIRHLEYASIVVSENIILASIGGFDRRVKLETEFFLGKFDINGNFIESYQYIQHLLKISPSGKYFLYTNYYDLYLKTLDDKLNILIDSTECYYRAQFLKNDTAVIYQNNNFDVIKYDILNNIKIKIISCNELLRFSDSKQDGTSILCTNGYEIFELNFNEKKLNKIVEFEPYIFQEKNTILAGNIVWVEEGKSFLFTRDNTLNYLWRPFMPITWKPDLFFFDIPSKKVEFVRADTGGSRIFLVPKSVEAKATQNAINETSLP